MMRTHTDPAESPLLIFEDRGVRWRIVVPTAEAGDRSAIVYAAHVSTDYKRQERRELIRIRFPITRRETRAALLPLGLPEATREAAVKLIRARSIEAAEKRWDQVLPPEIVEWANNVLATSARGKDCVDNCRVARIGISSQMRRFRRAEARGCCGSSTFVGTGPDGRKYIFGFNFGH